MSFQCTVVTPEQQAFDAKIEQAILPAHDGSIGILSNRAPLLVKLGVGAMRLDLSSNQRTWMIVDSGVAQMKDNKLTIVTERAIPAENIKLEAAQAELAEAQARRPGDTTGMALKKHDLALARAKQELAGRRGA